MSGTRRRRAQPNTNTGVVVRQDEWVGEVVAAINKPDRIRQLETLLGSAGAVERFKTVVLHAIVHDQEKLKEADPLSVIEAVREAAALGLEPTGVLGEAWILPYKRTARLSVGYRGLLKLIRRSKAVAFVDTQVVYMNDPFTVRFGTNPAIDHAPFLFGERDAETKELVAERGGYRGAYAWAELVGTTHPLIEWMPLIDIEAVRDQSPSVKAKQPSPWDNHFGEMARKTPLRRLSKRLPLDPVAERALAVDEETDDIAARVFAPAVKTVTPARAAAVAAIEARRPAPEPEPGEQATETTDTSSADNDDPRQPAGTDMTDEELARLARPVDQSTLPLDNG